MGTVLKKGHLLTYNAKCGRVEKTHWCLMYVKTLYMWIKAYKIGPTVMKRILTSRSSFLNEVPVISHLPVGPDREVPALLENASGTHDPVVLICPGGIAFIS